MTKLSVCLLAALALGGAAASAAARQVVPFNSDRWEMRAGEAQVVEHLGRPSLRLKGGLATVKDSRFTDGVIEFDVAVTAERGFAGAVWRWQDGGNYEEFYIRPHQSGNPDANQYQPVFNGVAAWQLYHGEGYGAPVRYDFDQWMHVKVVVSGRQAEVYVRDMETPALFVSELKRETRAGRVGLYASNFAPAHYSNFSFTPSPTPPRLKGQAKPRPPAHAGTVASWSVSNPFDGKTLAAKYQLADADKRALTWQRLDSEPNGVTNLARLHGLAEGRDTVFARLRVRSDSEQVKRFRFGFSDAVRVYFNDRLVYGGSDLYTSRDYRFLGTVGLFDELYLPLRRGENDVWLAVTENFGGWGVLAQFEDTSGISFVN